MYLLPSLKIIIPGASSVPANIEPLNIVPAPTAIALATSPGCFKPPSAVTGTPCSRATLTTSCTAVNCGTPDPAIILVVQTGEGPIPTFNPSAPASIKSLAASPVAIFPTITSTEKCCFNSFNF